MLQVHINDRDTPMMVDTGATYTCISPNYASHLPRSGKYAKTIGFSGQAQLIPMTTPVKLATSGRSIEIPILIAEHTPVNLLGRDALCRLGLQIQCSPDGIIIDNIGIKTQMSLHQAPLANVYWIGNIESAVREVTVKWGSYIEAQLPRARLPTLAYHCTLKYDPYQERIFEQLWLDTVNGKPAHTKSQYFVIGRQGAAMEVSDAEGSTLITDWFDVPGSVPHVTLLINDGFKAKDLGPMMKRATQVAWVKTDNPLIFRSPENDLIKILCFADIVGEPQEVEVGTGQQVQMGKAADRQEQLREGMERIVPEQLWSQHDTDVGLVKSASPVFIKVKPGAKPVWKRQYHMKPDAVAGIEPTIEGLAEADVLEETVSDCNTPLFPVLKADKQKWRLVHDLRPINDIVEDCLAEVLNPHTLLTNIPPEAKFFSVIDLCGAFFSVPLAVECRHLFAFTYGGRQYRYTRLPQGFKHSPHIFNQVLKADLEELVLEGTLLQYVDDLLICAPTLEQCHADSIKVLQRLAEGGHKVSRKKLQYCQTEVEYLGRTIAHQTKAISPTQLEGLSSAPLPQTVSQMMTFLGMTGFSSDWIEDYALKVSPLRGLLKEVGQQQLSAKLHWNCDALAAFETIKQDMQSAPALGTPDYTKPFLLYVANRAEGYASAVLMQDTCSGRRKQPIAYYSTKLDSVAQGYPPCYQGLAAVQYAYDKASTITMGYPVIIHTHHKVTELIEHGKFVLTNARLLDYLPLLTYPDITIKKCTTVNPAERIPLEFEGEPHDCVAESLTFTRLRPDLLSLPIPGAEEELFVDGSCYRDIDGNHAGFAVVRMDSQGQFHTIVSQTCPQPCSAQLAELKALTAACREGEGKVANIYTDSAYAHGVCHLFGAVWKQRGFKKTDGSPILHHEHIQDLMGSLLLPRQVAIIKCQAHRKGNNYIIQGNNAVDEAAKLASKCHSAILAPLILVEAAPVMSDVIRMQEMANVYEKQLWLQRGATTDAAGLWRTHTVPVLRGPHEGPPLEQLELEFREYIRQLTTIHELIHKQEKARVPEPEDDQPRAVVPGDQVYIKVCRRRWNEPRREGPYRVTQATTTAVRVEGSDTWYHLNHCTKVPQGVGQHEEDENADLPGGSESQEGEGVAPSAPEELVPQPEKSEPSREKPDVGVENAHAQSAVDSSGAMGSRGRWLMRLQGSWARWLMQLQGCRGRWLMRLQGSRERSQAKFPM
ncbi:uncharacterized protein LOC117593883 [Esox lucius]|uniref:uncharacterized protein LOC117593883 n=1 Tax=Esox lucius TaxID=8010 RepID=UPI001476B988|nr:uncharacterized protein LOC117593883 [Esox lucius]